MLTFPKEVLLFVSATIGLGQGAAQPSTPQCVEKLDLQAGETCTSHLRKLYEVANAELHRIADEMDEKGWVNEGTKNNPRMVYGGDALAEALESARRRTALLRQRLDIQREWDSVAQERRRRADEQKVFADEAAEADRKSRAEAARTARQAAVTRRQAQESEDRWVRSHPEKDVSWLRSKAGAVWRRHPDWSDRVCELVSTKRIALGMTREMVREAWGRPERINETFVQGRLSEQWVYPANNAYFENGILTSWQSSHK